MKKLIFIILTFIIACEAYCQTKYVLPYDSVIVMKTNGSGYLKGAKAGFSDTIFAVKLKYSDGNESNGYVLTSDANGNAHWAASSGGGNSNSNVGTGYRWAIPGTNDIKTFLAGYGLLIDSSTNELTARVDTFLIPTRNTIDSLAATFHPAAPVNSVQFNRNGVFTGSDTMLFKNGGLNLHYNDSVGSQINYAWNQNPLNTWSSSLATGTIAYGTGYTMFTGTLGYNLNNYIVYPRYIGVENYTIPFTQVITQKSNTSRGFMFNTPPNSGSGTGVSAYFDLSDTAGYITYNNASILSDFSTTNKSTSQFVWDVGDTVDFSIQKIMRTFIFTMTNRRNGSQSKLTVNGIYPQVGQPTIYFFSEAKFVENFGANYNVFYSPLIAGMGDSIFWGGNADTYDSKYFSILQGLLGANGVTIGAPAESSIQGTLRVTDGVAVHPQIMIYAYGVGDRNGGVALDSFSARVVRTIEPILSAGSQVLFLNLVPQTSGTVVPYNDTLQAIATRYSCQLVDIYTLLKGAGTAMNPIYDYGDGIHPNTAGHEVIAAAVYNVVKTMVSYQPSPLIVQAPLSSDISLNYAAFDKDNHLVSVPNIADGSKYILNKYGSTLGDYQSNAGINTLGMYSSDATFIIPGTGNKTSPNFSVNQFPTNPFLASATIMSKIYSGNFNTNISATGTNISGGDFWFTNDGVTTSRIRTASQQLLMLFSSPQTATNGLILQPGSQTGFVGTGWNAFQIWDIAGNMQFGMDSVNNPYIKYFRDGSAASADSVVVVIDGHLGVKTVSAGSSSLFPVTGTGTATGDVTGDLGANKLEMISNDGSYLRQSAVEFIVYHTDSVQETAIGADETAISLSYGGFGGSNQNIFNITSSGLQTVLAGTNTFTGGAGDSANYVGESYVQKDYVLDHIANAGGGATTAVDTIYRTVGKDSIQFTINGRYHAILDSASGGSSGANTALSNLASVAINTTLLPGTDDGAALGNGSKRWSDLFLANGGVINWNNGTTSITSTGGSSLAIQVDNGLTQFYKSGQHTILELYNAGIAQGFRFNTNGAGSIPTISTITNSGTMVFIPGASERLGVGGAPDASAKLDVQSTTLGLGVPSMTTTQKNAISSPRAGLVVYDSTLGKLCVFTTGWETVTSL